MAKPTAITEAGGSKVLLLADSTATTPAAKTPAGVVVSASGEATYPVGWMGVATHGSGEAIGSPGGFSGASRTPIIVVGGSDGTLAQAVRAASSNPAGTEMGLIVRTIPSGTTTISGTITANIGGTWNVGLSTGANTIGAVGINAGTNAIGSVREFGWDHNGLTIQRGLAIGITATTAQTLLAADASFLYNVLDVEVDVFNGTAALPTGATYLSFRHGAGGTEFLRCYLPVAAINTQYSRSVHFRMPSRGANAQVVECQLNQALGTGGQYSVTLHAYKS